MAPMFTSLLGAYAPYTYNSNAGDSNLRLYVSALGEGMLLVSTVSKDAYIQSKQGRDYQAISNSGSRLRCRVQAEALWITS